MKLDDLVGFTTPIFGNTQLDLIKKHKRQEPPPRKTSKSEPAAPVPVSPPVVVKPAETNPVEMLGMGWFIEQRSLYKLNPILGGIKLDAKIYGNFEGFPLQMYGNVCKCMLKGIILREFPDFNSALFGLVSYFISWKAGLRLNVWSLCLGRRGFAPFEFGGSSLCDSFEGFIF